MLVKIGEEQEIFFEAGSILGDKHWTGEEFMNAINSTRHSSRNISIGMGNTFFLCFIGQNASNWCRFIGRHFNAFGLHRWRINGGKIIDKNSLDSSSSLVSPSGIF